MRDQSWRLESTYLGVPDTDGQWSIINGLQEYRLRPAPHAHDMKEPIHHHGCRRIGIELAYARHGHGPCYTAQESHDVGVDGTLYRDASE